MNKNLLYFLKIFFAISVIYYLYDKNKISLEFFHNFLNFNQLFFSIFFFMLFYLLSIFRWFYILKKIDKRIKFIECFKYDSSSIIFNFLLPIGEISGEIYRGHLLIKEKNFDKKKAISSIVIDRGSGALSLILLSIFFLPFLFYLKYDSKLIFLIYILIILFLFNLKKILSFLITKTSLKLINYNLNLFKKTILPCILISILSFFFYFTSMIFLSKNLLLEYDNLYKSILIFPLGLLINAIPISPGGIGVGSLGFILLSNYFFLENYIFLENGILALQIFFLLLGMLFFLIFSLIKNKKNIK